MDKESAFLDKGVQAGKQYAQSLPQNSWKAQFLARKLAEIEKTKAGAGAAVKGSDERKDLGFLLNKIRGSLPRRGAQMELPLDIPGNKIASENQPKIGNYKMDKMAFLEGYLEGIDRVTSKMIEKKAAIRDVPQEGAIRKSIGGGLNTIGGAIGGGLGALGGAALGTVAAPFTLGAVNPLTAGLAGGATGMAVGGNLGNALVRKSPRRVPAGAVDAQTGMEQTAGEYEPTPEEQRKEDMKAALVGMIPLGTTVHTANRAQPEGKGKEWLGRVGGHMAGGALGGTVGSLVGHAVKAPGLGQFTGGVVGGGLGEGVGHHYTRTYYKPNEAPMKTQKVACEIPRGGSPAFVAGRVQAECVKPAEGKVEVPKPENCEGGAPAAGKIAAEIIFNALFKKSDEKEKSSNAPAAVGGVAGAAAGGYAGHKGAEKLTKWAPGKAVSDMHAKPKMVGRIANAVIDHPKATKAGLIGAGAVAGGTALAGAAKALTPKHKQEEKTAQEIIISTLFKEAKGAFTEYSSEGDPSVKLTLAKLLGTTAGGAGAVGLAHKYGIPANAGLARKAATYAPAALGGMAAGRAAYGAAKPAVEKTPAIAVPGAVGGGLAGAGGAKMALAQLAAKDPATLGKILTMLKGSPKATMGAAVGAGALAGGAGLPAAFGAAKQQAGKNADLKQKGKDNDAAAAKKAEKAKK